MSRIDNILKIVNSHKQCMIVCSRCKGTGIVNSHVDMGRCFKCYGSGEVENKWMKLHSDAIELKNNIKSFSDKLVKYENETDDVKKIVLRLRYVSHKESVKNSFKKRILELEKKAGIKK